MSLLVDDRELLHRFRTGDAATLRRVLAHFAPRLAALLRRGFTFTLGERCVRFSGYDGIFDLEDALQETFRRAFSDAARRRYDGLRPYGPYLNAIAKNVVINAFVARQRALDRFTTDSAVEEVPEGADWSAADDPLADGESVASGDPDRDLETGELRELVREYEAGLDERERRVFALRFAEGLSHSEITERTGLSPSKIKSAEGRIRKRLLGFLRRRGYLAAAALPLGPLARTPIAGEGS